MRVEWTIWGIRSCLPAGFSWAFFCPYSATHMEWKERKGAVNWRLDSPYRQGMEFGKENIQDQYYKIKGKTSQSRAPASADARSCRCANGALRSLVIYFGWQMFSNMSIKYRLLPRPALPTDQTVLPPNHSPIAQDANPDLLSHPLPSPKPFR